MSTPKTLHLMALGIAAGAILILAGEALRPTELVVPWPFDRGVAAMAGAPAAYFPLDTVKTRQKRPDSVTIVLINTWQKEVAQKEHQQWWSSGISAAGSVVVALTMLLGFGIKFWDYKIKYLEFQSKVLDLEKQILELKRGG